MNKKKKVKISIYEFMSVLLQSIKITPKVRSLNANVIRKKKKTKMKKKKNENFGRYADVHRFFDEKKISLVVIENGRRFRRSAPESS